MIINKNKEQNLLYEETKNYVNFEYKPTIEGIQNNCKVTESDEITTKNNILSTFIKVLKNKRVIAMFAGSPNPDFAFIKRTLKEEKGIEIKEFVQKYSSEFYINPTEQQLSNVDMFIFNNFPISSTPNQILNIINTELNKGNLYFCCGLTTDYSKLKLQDHLPLHYYLQNKENLRLYLI